MLRLTDISTRAAEDMTKRQAIEDRDRLTRRLGQLQHTLYAEHKHSMLIVFQGMDASGKDGAAKKTFRYCSPTGVSAFGFKRPSTEEFEHDFLWRVHRRSPRRGQIQIFNRSHYEDILIQRVHNWIDADRVRMRMAAINSFEQLLEKDNRTRVVKFYMHISERKQEQKLRERIEQPTKNWKHNSGDWEERKHWSAYMEAYEYAIHESIIPWHIVPSDQRWYRDYVIAKTLVQIMESMDMSLPVLDDDEKHF